MSFVKKIERGKTNQTATVRGPKSILSWTILAVGAATAAFTIFLIIRSYTPVLYVDQWSFINYLLLHKTLPLQWFWAQHNEHRLPILKVLQLMDLYWFRGHNILLLALSVCVVATHVCYLVYIVQRLGVFPAPPARLLAGAAAFCLFCPNQWETFVFGFALHMLMAYCCASIAIGSLILYWKSTSEGLAKANRFLILSIAAACLGECSLAGALLLWPILSIGAWMLRLSRRVQLTLGCIGAAAIAIFLAGWESLPGQPKPWTSLSRPFDLAHYIVLFFGSSWRQVHGALTGVMGAIGVLSMGVFCAWTLLRRPQKPLLIYCALMGGFLLATGFVTALGRVNLGLDQASSSRYETPAMLFWWTLLATVVALWTTADRPARLLPIAVLVAGAMLIATTSFPAILDECMGRRAILATGRMAIQLDVRDDEYIARLFPNPVLPFDDYRLLWQRGLALPGPDPLSSAGERLLASYQVAPADSCSGAVDSASAIGDTEVATGWASDRVTGRGATAILFADSAGSIRGAGVVGLPRPDVKKAKSGVTATNVGWHGFTRLPARLLDIYAFAVMPDRRSVCGLGIISRGSPALSIGK